VWYQEGRDLLRALRLVAFMLRRQRDKEAHFLLLSSFCGLTGIFFQALPSPGFCDIANLRDFWELTWKRAYSVRMRSVVDVALSYAFEDVRHALCDTGYGMECHIPDVLG
jgi:hypothetical protein